MPFTGSVLPDVKWQLSTAMRFFGKTSVLPRLCLLFAVAGGTVSGSAIVADNATMQHVATGGSNSVPGEC